MKILIPTFLVSLSGNFAPALLFQAACGCMAGIVIVYLLFIAAILGIAITIIVLIFKYIRKDAIARGMPNYDSVKWLALLGLLGLLIYVLTRPQGNVVPCPHCGQGRMQGLPRCPNCGNP